MLLLQTRRRKAHFLRLSPRHFSSTSALDVSWVAKVISTVFAFSPPLSAAAHLAPFHEALTPLAASEAVRRLPNHQLSLAFLQLTRSAFHVRHLPAAYRHVVENLCWCGHRNVALEVFDEMLADGYPLDGPVLEVLVNSHVVAGELDAAMGLISRASQCDVMLRPYCFNNVMDWLIARGQVQDAVQFFYRQLGTRNFAPDTCSFNIVIKCLCRLGDMKRAFEVFHDIDRYHCCPDTITHNIIIDGLCKTDQVDSGRHFLVGLLKNIDCPPNVVTYTSIIRGYCKKGQMQEAQSLFFEMVSRGVRPNIVTYNVLIDGYSKAGDMASAVSIYKDLVACGCSPDRVTFTSLIDGYCRNGQVDNACTFWHQMKEANIWPNAYAYTIFINAFCKQNQLSEAQLFLMEMTGRKDILPKAFMFNPVIDGLCKVGNVDEANMILAQMEDRGCLPDKITYTILIIGHCLKGMMLEAIVLFNKMFTTGCIPDNITISALTSCLLKGGRPDEANRILASFGKEQR